jgi:hypothetical protein
LLDVDHHLGAVDVLHPQPQDLARPQSGAVTEAQKQAVAQRVGHRQEAPGLVLAERERHLLRLVEMIDLGRQIVPAQRHPEQEAQARHGGIAGDDADFGLGQMQLESTDVVGGRRVGRALQPGCEPLVGPNAALVRGGSELAAGHVLDHALAERIERGNVEHEEFLPE